MLETYSHLNLKDVDEKTLQLHGLKPPKNRLSSLIEIKKCPGCQEDNAPYALYCRKCNRPLQEGPSVDTLIKSKEELMKLARALKDMGLAITTK